MSQDTVTAPTADEVQAKMQGVVEQILAYVRDLSDASDFCVREGFYSARVRFGEQDSALIRLPSSLGVTDLASFLTGAANTVFSAHEEMDLMAALSAFLDKDSGGVWMMISRLLIDCVVEWTLPEATKLYGLDGQSIVPSARKTSAQAISEVQRLPNIIIVRIIVAILWLEEQATAAKEG